MADSRLLMVSEVKKLLSCSTSNVYALVGRGELRCYRVGAGKGGIRFSEEQVQDFLHRRETKGAGPGPAPEKVSGDFSSLDGDRLKEAWKSREP
jgi:excisionase family DNA binding protein